MEQDLQNKIAATLEPLLGADHFRAGVSAEVDFTSGEQSEEIFDPQKSVMVTSQTHRGRPGAARGVGRSGNGVESAPPDVDAVPTGVQRTIARKTESISYQTSRVVKHTQAAAGDA